MFIHFGMSTYDGQELSLGDQPSTRYHPTNLDVDQWVCVARDAGMEYAVLTAKHVSGHCLWPSAHTDYHVGTSANTTDVVAAFVKACEKRGILPGLYYCSWDNHHLMGSQTPTFIAQEHAWTSVAYREFQLQQVHELLTNYGPLVEMWIDIPQVLGAEGRQRQYDQIATMQPDALVAMNHSFGDGSQLNYATTWPTDVMTIERWLPNSNGGYNPWHKIGHRSRLVGDEPVKTRREPEEMLDYYLPGEVCDPIGYDWFFRQEDRLRSVEELLGMRLVARERRTNFLLNVPPNKSGVIPAESVSHLMRLRRAMDRLPALVAADRD